MAGTVPEGTVGDQSAPRRQNQLDPEIFCADLTMRLVSALVLLGYAAAATDGERGPRPVSLFARMRFLTLGLCCLDTYLSDHPTLPTMWVSETKEPEAPGGGVGVEAYNFVAKPTRANPSAIWSNYTDCERLIYDGGGASAKRYLVSCLRVNQPIRLVYLVHWVHSSSAMPSTAASRNSRATR